jgi:hypothetical protein
MVGILNTHAEPGGALTHDDGKPCGEAGRIAAQLKRRPKLLQLPCLPCCGRLAIRGPAASRHDLRQTVLGVDHAEPSGAAIKVAVVVTPNVLVLAEKLLGALLTHTNLVQDFD